MQGEARAGFALPVRGRAHVEHHPFGPDALDDARLASADNAVRDPLDSEAERLLAVRQGAGLARVTGETQTGSARGLESRVPWPGGVTHLLPAKDPSDPTASREAAGLACERNILVR